MAWRDALAAVALVSGALSGVVIACSSFSSENVGGEGDAGAETSTDADASTTDGGADASDGARARFCDAFPKASFCFSFDEGPDPRIGARLEIVSPPEPRLTDAATSPPNALATDVKSPGPAFPGDGGPASGVRLDVMDAGTHAHCDLQLWAEQVDPDASVSKASVDVIFVQAGSRLFDFSLVLEPGTSTLGAQTGISGTHTMVSNIGAAAWNAIGFDLEVVSGQVTVHGTVTGAASAPVSTTGPAVQKLGDFRMFFGQTFVTGHWIVRLDDLVCTWN